MASTLIDTLYSLLSLCPCLPSSPTLRLNSRSFRLLRLLGEGGFSYVYLVSDTSSSALYALKKIRCPFGQESVAQALREVEAYRLFADSEHIIHSVDYAVQDDKAGGRAMSGIGTDAGAGDRSKTVYILLPYYRRGNLQDAINANLVNHTRFSERQLMLIMLGVCSALKAMHQYKARSTQNGSLAKAKALHATAMAEDADARAKRKGKTRMEMTPQEDAEEGAEQSQPLMPTEPLDTAAPGHPQSYAHRDIKPSNIMLSDSGAPILMDLGSLSTSPTPITSRPLALAVQDTAAEHSTMPYRAPELFDVKTGSVVDTKVDIWSLGATMYACLVGKSPFEARSEETGGSLSMCVLGGDWRWPGEEGKGKGKAVEGGKKEDLWPCQSLREVVKRCLSVEPTERPDVDELAAMIRGVLGELPEPDTVEGEDV